MLRIGTRKSALALWQAERVQGWLRERGQACELVPMHTEGDRILDRSLAEIGGKGLFVKELEQALSEGRADLAVHSAKDVPYALPLGFALSAFPQREDPRDALVAPLAKTFASLPRGARVGTSSLRRAVQLLAERPDLTIVPVRGNVQTRLARATGAAVVRGGVERRPAEGDAKGPLDAVVLALAGLRRLGLEAQGTEVLAVELSLPAPGQGALVIEAIRGSAGVAATVPLDDAPASHGGAPERAARAEAGVRLAGARVLVTRAAEDAAELEALLRERGAVPLRMPCIAFEDGPDVARIASVLRDRQADLVVVASPQAARRLLALDGARGVPVAAAGAATARELPGEVIVPRTGVGAEALVREISGRVRGRRVLIARAEGGNPALVDGLRAAGAIVEACTLYRTVTARQVDPEVLRALREGRVDAIAFASGSAARGFAALAGPASAERTAVACMGRQCAEEARKAGLRVDAVADGLLPELCDAVALALRAGKG